MMVAMRHIDLCSGIGGFSLAAHAAGFKTQVFCEKEPFCQKVLQKNFPGIPIVSDLFNFDGRRHLGADLLTAGIPCQPYSVAGKRLGNEDDRALWPEVLRIITEARPQHVVIENVTGFVSLALDGVLSDLEKTGYTAGTVVLPACSVNAPHRRDRVWIVAHAQSITCDERFNGIGQQKDGSCRLRVPARTSGSLGTELSSGSAIPDVGRVGDGLSRGLDRHFNREPPIPRVAHAAPHQSERLKALGNAIVPQIALQILLPIVKFIQQK